MSFTFQFQLLHAFIFAAHCFSDTQPSSALLPFVGKAFTAVAIINDSITAAHYNVFFEETHCTMTIKIQ